MSVVVTSDTYEDLVALGGSRFMIINVRKRVIVSKPKKTSCTEIGSIKFCKVGKKLLLLVSGNANSIYYPYYTDIFEVSKDKKKISKYPKNERPRNRRIYIH
jgi:hypothetical protein